jgi:hypothetical protein
VNRGSGDIAVLMQGMRTIHTQARARNGRFTQVHRAESEVGLLLRASPPRALYELDDRYLLLPTRSMVDVHEMRADGDPAVWSAADGYIRSWVSFGDRAGSPLNDRDPDSHMRQRLEFLTPDGRSLTVRVYDAEMVATRYHEVHGLHIEEIEPHLLWRVVMTDWPAETLV